MSLEFPPVRVVIAVSLFLLLAPSAHAAFPGANGKIAFERDNEIFLMNGDGSGAAPLTSDGIAKRDPVVSVDGRFVAYAYDGNIWVINADGRGAHAITTAGANDQSPAFSPDGKKIAFLRGSDGDIYSINVDGTGLRNLTNDPGGQETDAAWSPDGTRIAYTRTGCTPGTNEGGVCIWVMNADGSSPRLLTPEENYPECPDNAPGFAHRRHSEQPSWSPDGRFIAYAGYWNTCRASGGGGDIWVMAADGSGKRNLIDDTGTVDRQPSWSPDGSLVAFVSDRVDNPSGPDADIFTVPVTGGPIRALTSGLFTEDPDWGPALTLKAGRCANRSVGTFGGEGLAGMRAGDRIRGLGGKDVIRGFRGADCLAGGSGNDSLFGGPGKDKLIGGGGRDQLVGNGSVNRYSGGAGNDSVNARNRKRETVKCGPGRRDKAIVDARDRTRGCERVRLP